MSFEIPNLVKHYVHILHAPSDATMYRLFGIDYFDSVLLSGDYQKKDIRLLEQQRGINEKELTVVGCPYLDTLKEKMQAIPAEENHNFTVHFGQAATSFAAEWMPLNIKTIFLQFFS